MRKRKTRWHPEEIKCAVRMKGATLTDLALSNGLPEAACRLALIRSHRAAEAVIARFLGVSARTLWPDRYDADGRRKHVRSGRDDKPVGTPGHRQKAGGR